MKKEINLAHLNEIDKAHAVSTRLMNTVNVILEHVGLGPRSKKQNDMVGDINDNNMENGADQLVVKPKI